MLRMKSFLFKVTNDLEATQILPVGNTHESHAHAQCSVKSVLEQAFLLDIFQPTRDGKTLSFSRNSMSLS